MDYFCADLRCLACESPEKLIDQLPGLFLFTLKKIIRAELSENKQSIQSLTELYDLDAKFERLYLQAFDIYNDCRLKIQEIRMAEIKARSERAFEILNKTK